MPADARPGRTPHELRTLIVRARGLAAAAQAGRWSTATFDVPALTQAGHGYQTKPVPQRLGARLRLELDTLSTAVKHRRSRAATQAALHIEDTALDLELQYRPPAASIARGSTSGRDSSPSTRPEDGPER